jgi:hypothetical protein
MSLRRFLYYCWLWGACATVVGWLFGQCVGMPRSPDSVARDVLPGLALGLALGVVDALSTRSPQHLLAASWPIAAGAVFGAIGGGLNGIVTDALLETIRGQEVQLVGWAIMGALIGAGPGFGDLIATIMQRQNVIMPIRKIRNGVIGGAVGGVVGGGAVLGLRALWPRIGIAPTEDLWTTMAAEQAVSGAGVGLVFGLVQVVLREAWVQVESALGRGSAILLSRTETSLGSAGDVELYPDAEVAPIHAFIRRTGADFILTDAGTAAGTHVNDRLIDGAVALHSGDLIRIGRNTLLFLRRG